MSTSTFRLTVKCTPATDRRSVYARRTWAGEGLRWSADGVIRCRTAMIVGLLTALLGTQGPAFGASEEPATDSSQAHSLHEQNCVSCHGTEVYTREDRKVDSLASLESQVRRCDAALELRWFDEEIKAVTELLNSQFYQFKP